VRARALTLTAVVLIATGCRDQADREAFCAAHDRLDDTAVPSPELSAETLERARSAYEDMAEHAPQEIDDDVRLLNETFQRLAEGDVSFVADEARSIRIAEALDAVDDYADENCD
jgi:hypothetical protein